MAAAATRTFAYVKSSAMIPRQPSVPNFTTVVSAISTRSSSNPPLDQGVPSPPPQLRHYLAHILRPVASSDQQRVLRLHDYQITHPNQCNHFARRMNVVAGRIDRDAKRILAIKHIRN